MNSDIERLCRALCEYFGANPDAVPLKPGEGYSSDDPAWKYQAPMVRAILSELRKPSERMIEAGMKHEATDLAAEFTAMIDSITEEDDGKP